MELLNQAANEKELSQYTQMLEGTETCHSFSEYFSHLLKEKNASLPEVIAASLIQRNYAYQIVNGQKNPSRDKIIALCLSLGCDRIELDRCLKLAGLSPLYSKNRRDSILVFAVGKHMPVIDTNALLDEMKEPLLQ